MHRDIFSEEHELFREQFRRFAEKEIAPKIAALERARHERPRDLAAHAARRASSARNAPGRVRRRRRRLPLRRDRHGGARLPARARAHDLAALRHLHAVPDRTTAARSRSSATCRGAIAGEILLGIAMTEPGTGSDLANVQTRARRDGDDYVINGAKTFISNGQIGDLFIVVAKTDPNANPPHHGISLFLVEAEHARASCAAASSTSSACAARTPASSSSRTAACRRRHAARRRRARASAC